jgi:hypothetical protein
MTRKAVISCLVVLGLLLSAVASIVQAAPVANQASSIPVPTVLDVNQNAASQTLSPSAASTGTFTGITNPLSGTVKIAYTPSVRVKRVVFQLDGKSTWTENTAPYCLGGDSNGRPYGYDSRKWSDG